MAADAFTDDHKLIEALLQMRGAETAWRVAEAAGVEEDYALGALSRMADHIPSGPGDEGYPVYRRRDLGPDVFQAIEPGDDA